MLCLCNYNEGYVMRHLVFVLKPLCSIASLLCSLRLISSRMTNATVLLHSALTYKVEKFIFRREVTKIKTSTLNLSPITNLYPVVQQWIPCSIFTTSIPFLEGDSGLRCHTTRVLTLSKICLTFSAGTQPSRRMVIVPEGGKIYNYSDRGQ